MSVHSPNGNGKCVNVIATELLNWQTRHMNRLHPRTSAKFLLPLSALSALGVAIDIPASNAVGDGIYVGDSFSDRSIDIKVEITIQNGKIVQAKNLNAQEPTSRSSRWLSMAQPLLIQETLAAQSEKIAGVSGASYTSAAWQKSLASAIAKSNFTSSQAKASPDNPTPSPVPSIENKVQKLFTTIAGTNCPTLGKTVVVSDRKFTCTRVGKKLFWDKGKAVPIQATPTGKLNLNSDFKFMSDLLPTLKANGFDCTNYVKDPESGLGTREGGNCSWNGQDITITLFAATNSQVKELINAFKAFSQGYILLRSNWALSVTDPDTAKSLSSLLSMEIV